MVGAMSTAKPARLSQRLGTLTRRVTRESQSERAQTRLEDFVIITGDLTFLVHAELAPLEYSDAWNLIDRLEVPAFLAPGNHDLYSFDDIVGDSTRFVEGALVIGVEHSMMVNEDVQRSRDANATFGAR